MSVLCGYDITDSEGEDCVSATSISTGDKTSMANYFDESRNSHTQLKYDLGQTPPCTTSCEPTNQNKQGIPNLNYFGLYGSDALNFENEPSSGTSISMYPTNNSTRRNDGTAESYPQFWGEGELEKLEQSPNLVVSDSVGLMHKLPQHRNPYHYQETKPITAVRPRESTNDDAGYKSKRMRLNEANDDAHKLSLKNRNPSKSRLCFFVHHAVSPYVGSTPQCEVPQRGVVNINAHAGTVNSIEWCLPQYSHLLLSTSMDRTVKVWNVFSTVDHCVQTFLHHSKAVKDAEWSKSGREILSCGYDRTARLCDVEKGTEIQCFNHPSYVTCLKYHPINHHLFMTGATNAIYSWDSRLKGDPVSVYTYKEPFGQVQDLVFLRNGREMISCTDLVSRDSADRNIMAWDVRSKVVLSNQIYQERYTCTRLKCHPSDNQFIVQTNGDYMALFSTDRPYAMNKNKRFEGHKVQGYHIGLDVSLDGSQVVSGSATGDACFYDYKTTRLIKKMATGLDVCMDAVFHPVLRSTVATCGWNGTISVLQ